MPKTYNAESLSKIYARPSFASTLSAVPTFIVLGASFILLALVIVCFAAYKIKARRFEFSTAIWKFATLRIMIQSDPEDVEPDKRRPGLEP